MPKSGRQPPQRSHPCRRRSAHTTPPVLHGNRTVLESALLRHHRQMVHVPDAQYAFESIDLKRTWTATTWAEVPAIGVLGGSSADR